MECYQERQRYLEHALGAVQTELQEVMETVSEMQRIGGGTHSTPGVDGRGTGGDLTSPPPRSALSRPERVTGDRRRAAIAESDAEELSSVTTGSELPVQDIVSATQTSQKEADKLELPRIPEGHQFRTWRLAVREAIASASRDPPRAFLWARKAEASDAEFAALAETEGFATLDSKLASALRNIVTGSRGHNINVEKEARHRGYDDDWPPDM